MQMHGRDSLYAFLVYRHFCRAGPAGGHPACKSKVKVFLKLISERPATHSEHSRAVYRRKNELTGFIFPAINVIILL